MFKRFINSIGTKFEGTVFGDAVAGLKYIYNNNEKLLVVEMVISYIASIFITGWCMLIFENMGPRNYAMSLRNIIAIWLKQGIFPSLITFVFVQVIVLRCILLFRTKYTRDEEGNFNVSTEGTYGTDGKMTEKELHEAFIIEPLDKIKATIFGKNPYNLKEMVGQKGKDFRKVNRNVFMVAGPSAGKSATFVINLIFQILIRGESAIISDPKGELFKICGELAKRLKYEVRILNLNPMFLGNSDPCNYLQYVGDDVDKAQVVANAIIANTTGGVDMLDFWNEGALNLLQAIILRINIGNDFPPEQKNLPFMFTYLTQMTIEELEADFETLPTTHPAYAPFAIFKDGDEKPKKQVLQGLRIKLKLFNSEKLKRILSETKGGIDILNPGRKKCLYFVGKNDQDSSMDSMISLFFTLEYQELVRYADSRNPQELPIPVHIVLDEYANFATIPDFEKKLSTVRSRDIITYIICQDINQLKAKHPQDTWRTVLNDCDYFMMLKTNDTETMNWWCEMAGTMTTNVKNVRYERNKLDILGIHATEQVSEGQGERKVYTTGEIRKLENDDVLVLVTQRNIAKLKTLFWKEHRFGKYLEAHPDCYILPVQHYPLWRLIDDGVVGEDYDYDNSPTIVLKRKEDEDVAIDENYNPDELLGINSKGQTSKINSIIGKVMNKEPQVQEVQPQKIYTGVIEVEEKEEKKPVKNTNNVTAQPAVPKTSPEKNMTPPVAKKKQKTAQLPEPSEDAINAARNMNSARAQEAENKTQQSVRSNQQETVFKEAEKPVTEKNTKETPEEKPVKEELLSNPEAPKEEKTTILADFEEVEDFFADDMIDMNQFDI